MTISVIPAVLVDLDLVLSTMMTLCGMVLDVGLITHAVPSTTLHGLQTAASAYH
jgi:hypothetical protein